MHQRLNNKGFSLLQVLVATSILGIVSASLMASIFETAQFKALTKTKTGITTAKSNLKNVMLHNVSWYNTIYDSVNEANNPKIECVRGTYAGSDIQAYCNEETGNLRIVDSAKQVYYDSFSQTSGFNRDGVPCNSFDSIKGNRDCPLRAEINWRTDCATLPCTLKVEVDFTYKTEGSEKKVAFNSKNYNFSFKTQP